MSRKKLDPVEQRSVDAFEQDVELHLKSEPPGSLSDDMKYAFSLIKPNPTVLDVGCGYGRIIKWLREIGPFQYTGIDPSLKMLEMGRQLNPEVDFRQKNLYELSDEFPPRHFDLVIAITTLSYVTPVRMREALTSIRSVVKDNGIGFFTFMNFAETIRLARNQRVNVNHPGPFTTLTGWKVERILPVLEGSGFNAKRVYYYGAYSIYTLIVRAK